MIRDTYIPHKGGREGIPIIRFAAIASYCFLTARGALMLFKRPCAGPVFLFV